MELVFRHKRIFWWGFRATLGVLIVLSVVALYVVELGEYALNLLTEMIGVVISTCITVFIIDRLYAYRERESLKRRLVRELGSGSNDHALNAASWLRVEGWLGGKDGVLKKADLRGADLRNVPLWFQDRRDDSVQLADLEGAIFWESDLRKTVLMKANLKSAEFWFANLEGAYLDGANLKGTELNNANLKDTRLYGAKMQGATLFGARHLSEAKLDGAIMPDGNPYEDGMNLARYLNPSDPRFRETEIDVNEIRKGMGLIPHTVVIAGTQAGSDDAK